MNLKEEVKNVVVKVAATKTIDLLTQFISNGKISKPSISNLKIGAGALLTSGGIAAGLNYNNGLANSIGKVSRGFGMSLLASSGIDVVLNKIIK
jgi:hypothetical protein